MIQHKVEVSSKSEVIEYARKLAWQLQWSEEKILEMMQEFAKLKTFDECLDYLGNCFINAVKIERH